MHTVLAHFACARLGSTRTREDSFSFSFPPFSVSHFPFCFLSPILCVYVALPTSLPPCVHLTPACFLLPNLFFPTSASFILLFSSELCSPVYTYSLLSTHHLKRVDIFFLWGIFLSLFPAYIFCVLFVLPSLPPKEKKKEKRKRTILIDMPICKAIMIRRRY